jgi:hypothetical protein
MATIRSYAMCRMIPNGCHTQPCWSRTCPFVQWTEILGSEPLTRAQLGRLTHHVHILEMNGDSFDLKQTKKNPHLT